MNEIEVRYAIIIGINDYSSNPLNFCVNDAMGVKDSLVNKCMFDEENVHVILSEESQSEKDIAGKYLEAIRKIESKFVKGRDSILFYFAGHGAEQNEASVLWFQESTYPIKEVFRNISDLNPKIQIYIIDACHSGNKVLSRKRESDLQNYLKNASGVMFLYACKSNEFAKEMGELSHGLVTSKVLDAINNEKLYDEDGYLTFNSIIDLVQKETAKNSGFAQNPVIENRIEGFYPFAFKNGINSNGRKKEDRILQVDNRGIPTLRKEIQDMCKQIYDKALSNVSIEEKYTKTEYSSFDNALGINKNYLIKEIVEYVENSKLIPLGNIICKKAVKKSYNDPMGALLKSIDIYNNIPSEQTEYGIKFENDNISSNFYLCDCMDINFVSYGIGYLIYQAKWGVVVLKIAFLLDWNGEYNNMVKNITIENIPFAMENRSLEILKELDVNLNEFIEELLVEWNKERAEELEKYRY